MVRRGLTCALSLTALQESQEAAQRAAVHDPDKLAAAGHTNTGQTPRQQMEAVNQGADPQVGVGQAMGQTGTAGLCTEMH